eukprot:TRINITY_DN2292_c0_g1_i9.p1 TRINITY_DN2292_c0_g1~~TRINITY_DN2292_c0_g1_i9.p1  ORF type:complete len:245 (+),score=52.36 TRINITY_DN2292_c0_g1_i9:455-1189(+)
MEAAYNLVHALEQFKWDADCNIFLKIAREELPEEAATAQVALMQDVVACVRLAYMAQEDPSCMSQQDFIDAIQRCLPMKPEQDLLELGQALVATVGAGNNAFNPETIFEETEEFSETPVVEGLRAQFVLDLENFRCQIEDMTREMAETSPDGVSIVSARKVRDAIKLVDALRPMEQCMEDAATIMNIPSEDIVDEDVVLFDEFSRSLRTVLIEPTLPPNSFLEKGRTQRKSLEYQAKVRKRDGM